MAIPFHDQQLQFMIDLTGCRSSYLDPIFRLLNYIDTMYFTIFLIALIWVGFSYRWGIRIFYLSLVSSVVNDFFKTLLEWPRPSMDLPEIGMFHPTTYGFPSGGAQSAMILGGLLIYYWKNKYALSLGVLFIALLSFTRLYIGVHYPIDILGGWVLGFALLYLFIKTIDPLEKFLKAKGLFFSFFLSEAIPLILLLTAHGYSYRSVRAMAVGLGIFLSLKYSLYLPAPRKIAVGLIRGMIAAIGSFFLFILLENFPSYYFMAICIWISLGASPFCKWALKG